MNFEACSLFWGSVVKSDYSEDYMGIFIAFILGVFEDF